MLIKVKRMSAQDIGSVPSNLPTSESAYPNSDRIVFVLINHLSSWIIKKRSDAKKTRGTSFNSGDELEDQLMQVDSLITSIHRDLMSTGAFNCRSYARALMTLEQLIALRKEVQATEAVKGCTDELNL
jgi:serine/threonine-protein kinase ATR